MLTVKCGGEEIEIESFTPEYAEVYGVPFSFIPCAPGQRSIPKPPIPTTHVRALEERNECEITFPRVVGYHYVLSIKVSIQNLRWRVTKNSLLNILPVKTEMATILGDEKFTL
jgi:type III restriction enzyme